MRVSRRGRGGRWQSRARSKRTEPYLSACGVNGGAGDATAEVGGDDCAREAQPEGAQEVVSTGLQGEAWACRGDQGRVPTALGRRYAHAKGARTYRALLEVVVENVHAIAVVTGRAGGAGEREGGGEGGGGDGGDGGDDGGGGGGDDVGVDGCMGGVSGAERGGSRAGGGGSTAARVHRTPHRWDGKGLAHHLTLTNE